MDAFATSTQVGSSLVASLPPKWATVFDNDGPVWTRRELLSFPDLMPGQYSLPFFLDNSEFETVLFTDRNGNVLRYCEDQLFEAPDQRLVWLDFSQTQWGDDMDGEWTSANWQAAICLYTGLQHAESSQDTCCLEAQASSPNEILLFADNFGSSTPDAPHEFWERLLRGGENLDVSSGYVWVGPLPESQVGSHVSGESGGAVSEPLHKYAGQALRIDPGMGRIALCHTTPGELKNRAAGCLRMRAHFYDTLNTIRERVGTPGHWMGLTCQYGSAAVGLGGGFDQCYAFLSGSCPHGSGEHAWQATNVNRSQGWHVFEVLLESNTLSIMIDGELVATVPSDGKNYEQEEAWLVAKSGDVGHWASVELLHTPPNCTFPRNQVRPVGERQPWQVEANDCGRWQIVHHGEQALVHGEVEPAKPQQIVQPPPPPVRRPSTALGALTIECWSLPGPEAELARIERVMGVFVERLLAAGVTIPENFERVGRCGARNDPQPCYIYRFGSRRVHISIRESEGGKLCLVVRCGGGFLDFAEFARKNGSLEQIKLLKMQRQSIQGREVLQLSSVYSKGERRIKEVNSANVTSRLPVRSKR